MTVEWLVPLLARGAFFRNQGDLIRAKHRRVVSQGTLEPIGAEGDAARPTMKLVRRGLVAQLRTWRCCGTCARYHWSREPRIEALLHAPARLSQPQLPSASKWPTSRPSRLSSKVRACSKPAQTAGHPGPPCSCKSVTSSESCPLPLPLMAIWRCVCTTAQLPRWRNVRVPSPLPSPHPRASAQSCSLSPGRCPSNLASRSPPATLSVATTFLPARYADLY
jgi:hypothetical protein